jgi:hypothetical protein
MQRHKRDEIQGMDMRLTTSNMTRRMLCDQQRSVTRIKSVDLQPDTSILIIKKADYGMIVDGSFVAFDCTNLLRIRSMNFDG